MKNNTGYLLCIFTISKLRSTAEQMPALVLFQTRGLAFFFNPTDQDLEQE
jgi:hypothetical protein